jgi:hypothetical protein
MEFRAEMFDMFNHPNFMLPVTDFNSGAFGQITAATAAKRIHKGLTKRYIHHLVELRQ